MTVKIPEVITRPQISIDRASKSFGLFDGWDLIREFEKYEDEETALAKAKELFAEKTDIQPEVVYPQITSMRITYAKPKKKKK